MKGNKESAVVEQIKKAQNELNSQNLVLERKYTASLTTIEELEKCLVEARDKIEEMKAKKDEEEAMIKAAEILKKDYSSNPSSKMEDVPESPSPIKIDDYQLKTNLNPEPMVIED